MRKLTVAAAIILTLCVAGVAALPLLLDPNQFRDRVQSELEKQLKRPVSLGAMTLKTFPLAIRVDDLMVGQPARFESANAFVRAKEVYVGVAFWPLLRKQVQIQTLRLTSPWVELIRNADGKWNYETGSSGSSSDSLTLDELKISDGKVTLLDKSTGMPPNVYEHIDATVRNIGLGRSGSVDGTVRLDGVSAVLSTNSEFRDAPEGYEAKGSLTLKSDKTADPLSVTYDARQDPKTQVVTVNSLAAKIGTLALTGSGTADMKRKPAGLNLNVKTANAPLRELMRIAELLGAKFPPDIKADGLLNVDLQVDGTTSAPQLQGKIEITKAEISGKTLAEPVRASELRADLTPALIATQPFTIETGGTSVVAKASVADYSSAEPKINVELKTTGAKVEELLRIAEAYGFKPEGLKGSGMVSLDVKILKTGNRLNYSGSGSLKDVQISSPEIPKPLGIQAANVNFAEDKIAFDRLQASMGSMHMTGSGSVRDFSRPEIQFQLATDQLNVAELREWRTGEGSGGGKGKDNTKAIEKVTANGTLSVGKILYDQITLTNTKATVALAGGVLQLSPMTTEGFGGRETGSITADLREPAAAYAIKTNLTGVDANQLLSSTTSLKGTLSGTLAGNVDLRLQPKANEDIAKTLNGTVRIQMGPGRLANVHILSEVAKVGKFLNFSNVAPSSQPFTAIQKMGGTLSIVNGLASTNDLQMVFDGGSLGGAGTVGLVDPALNLKLTVVLGQDVGQKAGGTQVGGWLTTVLANSKGELVIPAQVTGTMTKPVFAPDPGQMAKLKVQNLLPSAKDPAALVGGVKGILDALTGKQQQPGDAKPGDQPKGGLGDLIDQFRKKKDDKK